MKSTIAFRRPMSGNIRRNNGKPTSCRLLWMGLLLSQAIGVAHAAGQPAAEEKPLPVALVDALNKIAGGPHAGHRANHAKGVMASGQFIPTAEARTLSKAPLFLGKPVPITVRFSNDSGRIKFGDAEFNARPHGMAIRYHLAGGGTTDMVTNAAKAFPVATPEEFLALLHAVIASGDMVPKPTPLDKFLEAHPSTVRYLATLHEAPVSLCTLTYNGLNSFKYTNSKGASRYIRYQIVPVSGEQFLSKAAASKAAPDYLMDELPVRLAKGPVKYTLFSHLATGGDKVDDSSIAWAASNPRVALGTISLDKFVSDKAADKALLFNPVSLPDGIEPSADPVLAARFPAYAVSFGQRAN